MAEQVRMIGNLLAMLRSTEVARLPATKEPLDGLQETLWKTLELVESCKDKSYLYMLAMGWSVVNQFRHVQTQIDRYLHLGPLISVVHDLRMQPLINLGQSYRMSPFTVCATTGNITWISSQQRWQLGATIRHSSEEDQREYTLDEEEMESQNVILKINQSKKDAVYWRSPYLIGTQIWGFTRPSERRKKNCILNYIDREPIMTQSNAW
ncbi:unnamed protein product [Sphenostylis stenocarpa]|uniref:MCAfunc domain-containing protein n=1 Tax=Sphenostylis stenocarpa TaxID=92480 RepID=A0AA86SR89_9FABA|nr:unnamed protein product [Sphenostylis stenocarpa]